MKIVGLVYLLSTEGDPFDPNIDYLIFHSHHVIIELLHHIHESWSLVLIERVPLFAFTDFLEGGNPLVEISFSYEVFVL